MTVMLHPHQMSLLMIAHQQQLDNLQQLADLELEATEQSDTRPERGLA